MTFKRQRRANTAMPVNTAMPMFLTECPHGNMAESKLLRVRVAILPKAKNMDISRVITLANPIATDLWCDFKDVFFMIVRCDAVENYTYLPLRFTTGIKWLDCNMGKWSRGYPAVLSA